MRAVTSLRGDLTVQQIADPRPEAGQMVIEIERCGICGSDLHVRHGADELGAVVEKAGYSDFVRDDVPVVFGHEFTGLVAERGKSVARKFKIGTRVVALPLLRVRGAVKLTGLSPAAPGALAERCLVQASVTFAVPNGLPADSAALTEPMAIALHAVRRSEIGKRDVAIVIGCGPVGLAVICILDALGVRTIVASDFSADRRAMAQQCGADTVIDAAASSPYEAASQKNDMPSLAELYELGIDAMGTLSRIPGWQHLYRAAEKLGATPPSRPVVFECVGLPGIIGGIIEAAPLNARIVVVGVCVSKDQFYPALAIAKETDLRFVFGYTPLEFRDALHALADGKIDPSPILTGLTGLDGTASAFDTLDNPQAHAHAKILVNPSSTTTSVTAIAR